MTHPARGSTLRVIMSTVKVTFEDGRQAECDEGTLVGRLAPDEAAGGLPLIAALVNNDLVSLSYPLTVNSSVRYVAADDPHGWRVYRRSLCFLLAKAVNDLYPDAALSVEHSLGIGLYCSFSAKPESKGGISEEQLNDLSDKMKELVDRNLPIARKKTAYTDAVEEFRRSSQVHKLNLLRHRNPPRIVLHWCDGFSDLAHGPLAPATGVLTRFQLVPYPPGFVLNLPPREDPQKIPTFQDQPHLFKIYQEHKEWGRILGVNTVGRLNEAVADRKIDGFIRTAEALHEKKLARIADQVAAARDRIRLILIAGPSSAGKTTFAKRLMVHLTVNGLRPVILSTDNYFVGADRNPLDEHGQPDYEHVEAVDLELLNDHLRRLMQGEEVEAPYFNFEEKKRKIKGNRLRIEDNMVIIMEGIHGLNPLLTTHVPPANKFTIFVSALTQLSVDFHNRISTTDNRLMRRIVRDNQYRGHSALETLKLWPNVRRGEKRWIFPFQNEADATFNSALDYELAVLKTTVEPLLMQVKPSDRQYAEARRLTEFLLNFLAINDDLVPSSSILREYIGGSAFEY